MHSLFKNTIVLVLLMFGLISAVAANEGLAEKKEVSDGSEVIGVWQGDNNMERFEIYKKGDSFYGKIVWTSYKNINNIEGRGLQDLKNPDPTQRHKSIIGLEILTNFKYKGNGVYTSGRVYDPGSGHTYRCKIMVDGDVAKVRGYILVPAIGRTETAFRIK
jgi:uncharacterized protein (DUF2147 family)